MDGGWPRPGRRGARGPVSVRRPGTQLLIDEASMMTSADLADLIALADTNGAKVTIAGDTGQLQAVQNGGGMTLIADRLSYARLAEPIRFHAPREQAHQAIRWGWPVTLAMRSKSLSPCGTVSPASSAVAA